jgi:TctA family transporter
LALTSGIGALALTVLTGFTGVGFLGGAVLGAATAVGVAPQTIVVEPNQIIEVQILEDVPRSSLQL